MSSNDETSRLERGEKRSSSRRSHVNENYGSLPENDTTTTTTTTTPNTPNNNTNNHNSSSNGYHHPQKQQYSLERKASSSSSSNIRRRIFHHQLEALSKIPLRRVALDVSLYVNLLITVIKFVAYMRTLSLSVLAALLDSVLDVVSQFVLNYTEKHSSLQRSSAFYPAGAARLEPIGVLTCAALMGMGSFEVLKESVAALVTWNNPFDHNSDDGYTYSGEAGTNDDLEEGLNMGSCYSMSAIVVTKLLLLLLCQKAAEVPTTADAAITSSTNLADVAADVAAATAAASYLGGLQHQSSSDLLNDETELENDSQSRLLGGESTLAGSKAVIQMSDPTLEALAKDHWNDALSNAVAAAALLAALQAPWLWFLDPVGAIFISLYIIWSWFETGKEQIEQLTGKSAPEDFIEELLEIANHFDERMLVDVCRAYHFGPKFLVEIEVVLPKNTLLFESHDLGMELQYEIESRDEVERCFVHIDYEQRPYDEHVVSKVPELREKYRPGKDGLRWRSAQSL